MNINKHQKNYLIKVNKRNSNNKIYNTKNIPNRRKNNYNKAAFINNENTPSKKISFSKVNSINNSSPISSYQNQYNISNQIKPYNSNSEKKIKNERKNINRYQFALKKNDFKKENIFKDIKTTKYKCNSTFTLQPLDENIINYNNKKRNYSNLSLNNISYSENNFNTNNLDSSQRQIISIKTNSFNSNNDSPNQYKTLEHRNINNYINEFQLINNYFDYDKNVELNNLNYNKNLLNYSTDRKKVKNYIYSESNPLLYYSYEQNLNNNYENDEDNKINNNSKNENNGIKFPGNYFFKSNAFPNKNLNNYSFQRYYQNIYKNKKINKTDNNISLNSINNYKDEKMKENNIYIKCRSQYGTIVYNTKYNKFDYNKRLFDAYRGKLIQEFLRHIKNVVNNYLSKYFHLIIYSLKNIKKFQMNKDLFIQKIQLNKSIDRNLNKNNKFKNQKYIQIFYSDKKYPQEKEFDCLTLNDINKFELKRTKTNNNLNQIINNKKNFEYYKKGNNNFIPNKRIIKSYDINNPKENIIANENENQNNELRNSLNLNNNRLINKKNSISNNINIIDINTSLSNYIYKKKVKLSKNNTFINRHNKQLNSNIFNNNKTDINNNILSNLKGKIIDIDINLGKPVKEINDISPLSGFFINNYSSKNNSSSFSINKNNKHKRKHKNKNKHKHKKKYSLPKKKYLEKGYDIESPSKDDDYFEENEDNEENEGNKEKTITEYRTNSYDFNQNYFNNLINLNNSMQTEKKIKTQKRYSKNILVKNIITSDKRLFIHINYIFFNNVNMKNKYYYDINLLKIIINDYFTLPSNINFIKNKNKRVSNNSFLPFCYSRNNLRNEFVKSKTNYMQNQKDKYLLSCIKFVIKIINKIFLKKVYIHFKKCVGKIIYKNIKENLQNNNSN